MEKRLIKGLLSIGILGALFSSCFAQDYNYRNVEYFSSDNNINNYQFANNVAYNSLYSYTNSGGSIVSYSPYYVSSLGSLDNSVFDLTNYSLGQGYYSWDPTGKVYFNNGALSLLIGPSYTLFPIVPGNLTTDNLLLDSQPVYIRVQSDSSSCYTYDSINGNCTNALRSFIHTSTTVYDSLRGLVHDSVIDGVDWQKGTISSSVYNNYSYTFAFSGLNYDGYNVSFTSGFLNFKTVAPTTSGNYYSLDGVYLFRLNDLYLVNSSTNFQVIAIAFTGSNMSEYDFVYSVYNCPSDSRNIYNCSFDNGGYLRPSSNGNSFNSYDGKLFSTTASYDGNRYNQTILYWRNFLYFMFYPAGSLTFYNSYNPNTNIIEFYRYGYFSNDANSVNYSLYLDPLAGIDIIAGTENPFPDSGGGNNNSGFPDSIFDGGIFDANTYLIEESIKCYITSGEVCNSPFTYEGSENYVNNYSHQPRQRDSSLQSGTLTFNNAYDMLSQYCLNTNSIQYSFCSQLTLYNGYPITYYYNNGYFNYYIFGSGFTYNLGAMWSGQLGYAYCEGPYCSNFNQGLPQFIKKDTGDYSSYGFSGEYVSLDFFKNYFENGFFFQCPFSYSGSYFTIGSKLVDRLEKHDPLKPINCFIAAFSHGVKSEFFGDSNLGLSHSGLLLKNVGPNATRFYTFFDLVLCFGYIFLFSKLFKFLKKH